MLLGAAVACGPDPPPGPLLVARLDGETVRGGCVPGKRPRWRLFESPGGPAAIGFRQAAGSVCRLPIALPAGARLSLSVAPDAADGRDADAVPIALGVVHEGDAGAETTRVAEHTLTRGEIHTIRDLPLTPDSRPGVALELRHLGPPGSAPVAWRDVTLTLDRDPGERPAGWTQPIDRAVTPLVDALGWPSPRAGGRRLLVVGLDGASWPLVDALIAEGEMPNLAALVRRGRRGTLRSSFVPESAMAWTTLRTGVGAGRHGVFHFMSPDRTRRSYWAWLDDAGLRSVVIGVPKSSPAEPFGGVLVGGWNLDGSQAYTRPDALAEHLATTGYEPAIANVADTVRYAVRLRDRTDLARALLARLDWDHAFVVYEYTDTAAHRFGLGSEGWRAAYRQADRELGRLIADLPPDTTLLIVSDHGWKRFERAFSPDAWLRASGITDWMSHIYGGHRVALRPVAPLDPEAEAAALAGLERALAGLRDPETGAPVEARIVRFDEALPGPFAERSILRAFLELPPHLHAAAKAKGDAIWPDVVPEHHDVDGLYLLVGPDVAPGAGPDADLVDVAPTVAAFFGVTPPEDVTGRPIAGLGADVARTPTVAIGTRAAAPADAPGDARSPSDTPTAPPAPSPALRESLRALGYVDESE